jgi:hypothetical protein
MPGTPLITDLNTPADASFLARFTEVIVIRLEPVHTHYSLILLGCLSGNPDIFCQQNSTIYAWVNR